MQIITKFFFYFLFDYNYKLLKLFSRIYNYISQLLRYNYSLNMTLFLHELFDNFIISTLLQMSFRMCLIYIINNFF